MFFIEVWLTQVGTSIPSLRNSESYRALFCPIIYLEVQSPFFQLNLSVEKPWFNLPTLSDMKVYVHYTIYITHSNKKTVKISHATSLLQLALHGRIKNISIACVYALVLHRTVSIKIRFYILLSFRGDVTASEKLLKWKTLWYLAVVAVICFRRSNEASFSAFQQPSLQVGRYPCHPIYHSCW